MTWKVRILLFLALCGLLLNLLLLYWKLVDPAGGITGCNGGDSCADVLTSRWSQVFGVPIPILGGLVYLLLLVALRWDLKYLAASCITGVAGAAVWFVIVQAVMLRHFCPWCQFSAKTKQGA